MTNAIVLREFGGPETLRVEQIEVGAPGSGEVQLRQTAIGVNYHDVYIRDGSYPGWMTLPGVPGIEAAGVVDAVGPDVTKFHVGDRVAYITPRYGGYAGARLIEAERLVKLPDAVSDEQAAAGMVKGLTAWVLLHRVHQIQQGDTLLVHAAAGGVGRLLCAWANHLGARVIGTAGSAEKAKAAHRSGCHETILYREEDFVARVKAFTGGKGVAVVYDSVGRDTLSGSLACLAPLGHLVSFGQSSGAPAPVAMAELAARSITITRPVVFHYMENRGLLELAAAALFAAICDGVLGLEIAARFPLSQVGAAHQMLESRQAAGSLVLLP